MNFQKSGIFTNDNIIESINLDKPSPPRGPAGVEWKTQDTLQLTWLIPENDGGAKEINTIILFVFWLIQLWATIYIF